GAYHLRRFGDGLLNLENAVALHGYDAVAYFERERAVRGKIGSTEIRLVQNLVQNPKQEA
ncbi:MAG: hypothetical protein WBV16_09340, partial [Desulfobaccales bacterium]